MSRAAVVFTLVALAASAAVFAAWPWLDIAVARVFYGDGAFWSGQAARAYRALFYGLPFVVLAWFVAALVGKRFGVSLPGSSWIDPPGLAFLVLSLALGPGLLVNVGLKDHWHRPRPVQVREFGGLMEFRPIWRGDGACARNCSFVSGEVSSSAWLLAPASLAPPPLRGPAYAAALAVTVLTALGRMAFGGHFLSDAMFASIFTALTTQLLFWLVFVRGAGRRA